ncbi:MAG: Lipopolysaccharide core heptosyltransferase RfaQ [Syntrophomonadaceae bacterium]|nr:Lipopolysaccharide core heptosyltransferase RfaQ [Bacillota bacterium]
MNLRGYKYRFPEKWKRYFIIVISLMGYLIFFPLSIVNLFRRKEIDHKRIKKILLVRNDGIGDFVLSLPALDVLRQSFPQTKITVFIPSWQEEIASASNLFDEIVIFDNKKSDYLSSSLKLKNLFVDMLKQVSMLRKHHFDLAVDIRGDIRNRVIIFLSAIPYRLSFDIGGLESLLTHEIHYRENTHEVDHFNDLFSFCGSNNLASNFELNITTKDKEKIEQFLESNGILLGEDFLVAVHPVSRWPAKEWPKEKYAELCDWLMTKWRTKIVMIGSSEDLKEVEKILLLMNEKPVITAGVLSLLQTVALLKEADLFIGNDAAPMHIAAALKIPVIALFGPTDPEMYGPYGEGHSVIRPDIPCRCSSKKVCSNPMQFCMNSISVDSVFDHAERYIKQKKGGS